MKRHGIKPGHRVGVLGIGGLGHLAIQFAAKLGAEVVVFSGSGDKKDEAMRLGAEEFWLSRDLGKGKADLRLDYLIVTASKLPDWEV